VEKVTLDFEFKRYSYEYGCFLITCYESYPDIVVSDAAPQYWNYYSSKNLMVTIDAPEDLAIILKLKFRNNLKIRPTDEEIRELKMAQEEEKYTSKKLFMADYITLLNKNDSVIIDKKMEDVLTELKLWTKGKGIL